MREPTQAPAPDDDEPDFTRADFLRDVKELLAKAPPRFAFVLVAIDQADPDDSLAFCLQGFESLALARTAVHMIDDVLREEQRNAAAMRGAPPKELRN